MDLAVLGKQESARDHWIQQQMEEAMRNLPADLEVLPSPLLLEQMERENRRRGVFSSLSAGEEESPMAAAVTSGAVVSLPADVKAAASTPASSSATAPSPRLAAALPMPSSHSPLSFPELREKIRQIQEDYETAVRQFYCCPPPSSSSLQSSAAAQPTPGLKTSAAAKQATPDLQGGAAAQPTPDLQREQPTPRLQSATIVQPKSASTSSTRRRGCRKRDTSAQVVGGPGDASASAPGLKAFQGFSERLVFVLVPEPCDEGLRMSPRLIMFLSSSRRN
ncbi:hypothetical protein CRENBAI_023315 [Crenichthys baileyi]|uniref:Uncharacterized protein n=1 Tax=Crenichthys baileyi TaxID=28760 RepID=A0AAV9RAM1_9TELE